MREGVGSALNRDWSRRVRVGVGDGEGDSVAVGDDLGGWTGCSIARMGEATLGGDCVWVAVAVGTDPATNA